MNEQNEKRNINMIRSNKNNNNRTFTGYCLETNIQNVTDFGLLAPETLDLEQGHMRS